MSRAKYFKVNQVAMYTVLAFVAGILITVFFSGFGGGGGGADDDEARFAAAVEDALFLSEKELFEVTRLSGDDQNAEIKTVERPRTVINDDPETEEIETEEISERVEQALLLVWHDQNYTFEGKDGGEVSLNYGDVWAVSEREFYNIYVKLKDTIKNKEDWEPRLLKLFGKAPGTAPKYFTALWADVSRVRRPAYVSDVTRVMRTSFSPDETPEFREWFERIFIEKYLNSQQPWTRLGYTYDWGSETANRYGISEFVILDNTTATVEYTKTNSEILEYMSNRFSREQSSK